MGVVILPPLLLVSSEEVQSSRVPSLPGHYPASSLLRPRPPPSRRRTISRDPRLYARPDSADFAARRGGLLQLLDAAASPCCRSKPRRNAPPRQPDCVGPCCLRGVIDRSASGVWIFRGQLTFTCVTARCLAHHPFDGFVDRLQSLGLPPPCYPSYGASGSCPGGTGTRQSHLPFSGHAIT